MKADLLSAMLVDDEAFLAATLRQTVALARRRRRGRIVRRALGAASLLVAIAFLLRPSNPVSRPPAHEPPTFIVRTAPLDAPQRVRTRANLFTPVVSKSTTGLAVVSSEPRGFMAIDTQTAAPRLDLLSDQQLLTSFPGDRPALIAHGTVEARLVFY